MGPDQSGEAAAGQTKTKQKHEASDLDWIIYRQSTRCESPSLELWLRGGGSKRKIRPRGKHCRHFVSSGKRMNIWSNTDRTTSAAAGATAISIFCSTSFFYGWCRAEQRCNVVSLSLKEVLERKSIFLAFLRSLPLLYCTTRLQHALSHTPSLQNSLTCESNCHMTRHKKQGSKHIH